MEEGFFPYTGPTGLVRRPTSDAYLLYLRDTAISNRIEGALVILRLREDSGGTVVLGKIWSPVALLNRLIGLALFAGAVKATFWRASTGANLAAWAAWSVFLTAALLSFLSRENKLAARLRLTNEFRKLLLEVHEHLSQHL